MRRLTGIAASRQYHIVRLRQCLLRPLDEVFSCDTADTVKFDTASFHLRYSDVWVAGPSGWWRFVDAVNQNNACLV